MISNSLSTSYLEQTAIERRQRSKITCPLAIFFYLIGGALLDYVFYEETFPELLNIRLIVCVLLIAIYVVQKLYGSAQGVSLYIEILWPIIINASICWIIFINDGALSTYHAGLNVTLLGAMLLFLLTINGAFWIVVFTIIFYTLAIYQTMGNIPNEVLVNNYYFLLLTGIIACVASYLNEKKRFTEYSLKFQLDERNRELAELDRIKSNFFANISHELRTPLTLIISPIEDLLRSKQPFDRQVNQLLTTVKGNSYRLLKLVNDLLTVIRLDESSSYIKLKPMDVYPLLRGVVQSMKNLAEKQEIKLETNINFESAIIDGEVSALEKIFINLINNAIKFTPPNGVVTVSSHTNEDNVIITFKDTGIGIGKEDLPHIFDRFQQADSSTTRKYQGTGLGLALVKELTQSLNGEVKVTSELNKGTSIRLFFPKVDQKETETSTLPEILLSQDDTPLETIHQKADYSLPLNEPNTEKLEPIFLTEAQKEQPKLLIVEDEPDLRRYLVNTLSSEYQVISAADGAVGMELVMKHAPDLVLLDLMLPKIDGLQLCKQIKSEKTLQFTKVILLTARIDEESKISALKNGADDFLTKPFSTIEVKTRLTNLWKSNQLERSLDKHNKELIKALEDLKAMESKLIHSEKLSAIGSLAAGLLHEVNNPLNYAITAVQMLQRDPEIKKDEDLNEMVDDIFEGMERIRYIVKDLHTFAYPDTVDKTQPFLISKAIESALRFTASERKGITIENDVSGDLMVLGSTSHIVQVLINIITNASKALKTKENPTITINAIPAEPPEIKDKTGRIVVTIRDNGTGIKEENIKRIFDPFFTTRDVGEGLGMGLSISYTIIKNHGSTIEVNSNVGEYTEFSFDLERA